MSKVGKILLYILSWGPLVWTILILIAARNYNYPEDSFDYNSFKHSMKEIFFFSMAFYVLWGGFFIWLGLTILLTWKKIITKRQCIVNISLTTIGILSAYLALDYDIFGVSAYYLD